MVKLTRPNEGIADLEPSLYHKRRSFNSGYTITDRKEVLLYSAIDGGTDHYYQWMGALPKVVPILSTPTTSGGFGTDAWRDVKDATIVSILPKVTVYTGVMPALGAMGSLAILENVSDMISATMLVTDNQSRAIMQNQNNPMFEFTFILKNGLVQYQTGDNAIYIAGMPYILSIFSKVA